MQTDDVYWFTSTCNTVAGRISRHLSINPLSPHDALEYHFTSLKTDLIFLQLGVLGRKIP